VTALAGHARQAWLPVAFLYVPSAHAPHSDWFVTVYPASHTHCALAVLAGGLPECAWQPVHACGPAAGLYEFATHASHGPPSGPRYPALHWHDTSEVAPSVPSACEVLPGHARQVAAPT